MCSRDKLMVKGSINGFGTMTNTIFKVQERQRQNLVLSHCEAAAAASPSPLTEALSLVSSFMLPSFTSQTPKHTGTHTLHCFQPMQVVFNSFVFLCFVTLPLRSLIKKEVIYKLWRDQRA